jgi:hypothetical protein
MAARRVGAVRKAAAACEAWWPVKKMLRRGTPRYEAMMPRTHTFSPSELRIACGNDRHDRGKARSEHSQDALELQHAALVEHDRVEIGGRQAGVLEAPGDGLEGETRVVLVARQPLLLHRPPPARRPPTSAAAES